MADKQNKQKEQEKEDQIKDQADNEKEEIKVKEIDHENESLDLKTMEDNYKRALADYQNLLKQTARDKAEFAKYANEQLILEIIPIYDNLKTALMHIDEEAKKNGLAEGINYVVRQFESTLRNFGIEEIRTQGEKYDHNAMEAVENESTDDARKDNFVAREVSSGYKLNGKVIKAARVVVYKSKE